MVTANRIRVGIIGASPDRGWAADAHIPALRALPQFELAAVSTSRKESAAAASRAYGVCLAFDNHQELVNRPDVDLVVIAVKVPFHLELATAALRAGKAVYCEWPLGNGLEEAEQLARLARDAGVVARVGLQARSSPEINYVRQLIAEGYVGKVLSSTIIASAVYWGVDVIGPHLYLLDRRNGATMLTIPFGHMADAFCWCLGEFAELSATFATQRPQVRLLDDGSRWPSNVADQISVTGTLHGGATASIHLRGGLSRGNQFLWEINGTAGDLVIEAAAGIIQAMPLKIKGGRDAATKAVDLPIPASCRWVPEQTPDGLPFNLAQAYVRVADDWRTGTHTAPTFDDAVVRHRMIEAVAQAAKSGQRQSYDPSPPK